MKVKNTNIKNNVNGKVVCAQCGSMYDVDDEQEMDSLALYCPVCDYFNGSI